MSNDIQEMSGLTFDLAQLAPDVVGELVGLHNPIAGGLPTIQWTNLRKNVELESGGFPDRGGFIMTESNAIAAGDFPSNGIKATIEFEPSAENPRGARDACVYMPDLIFAPLAWHFGWWLDGQLLPEKFSYQEYKARGQDPKSKLQIMALLNGVSGPFVAQLTFSSTLAGDARAALLTHITNVKAVIKRQFPNAPRELRESYWRWVWVKFGASAETTMRGQEGAQSAVYPVVYLNSGNYISDDLRIEFFDAARALEYDTAWNDAAAVPGADAPLPPQAQLPPPPPAINSPTTAGEYVVTVVERNGREHTGPIGQLSPPWLRYIVDNHTDARAREIATKLLSSQEDEIPY